VEKGELLQISGEKNRKNTYVGDALEVIEKLLPSPGGLETQRCLAGTGTLQPIDNCGDRGSGHYHEQFGPKANRWLQQ